MLLRDNISRVTIEEPFHKSRHALLDDCWPILRHAIRTLSRSPGFSIAVVLSLALGLGANTAMFTIVDAVLLQPLPYTRAHELMTIGFSDKAGVTWHTPSRDLDAWTRRGRNLITTASINT